MNTLIKNLKKLSRNMEQKRRLSKFNVFTVSLFVAAVIFAISLLLSFFDFGSESSGNLFCKFGNFLFSAYGYSSIFIPIFFLVAALQMIGSKWTLKRGVILAGSLVPFFTLVFIEHLCKIFSSNSSGAILAIKIISTLTFGAIVFAGEYVILIILGDVLQERYSKSKFDFDDLDESDFDKETDKTIDIDDLADEKTISTNDAESSVILDEMLEKATEIESETGGDTVLEFVRNQVKPVDLNEILFKSVEREVREEKKAEKNAVDESLENSNSDVALSKVASSEIAPAVKKFDEEPKLFSEIIEDDSDVENESEEDFWNSDSDTNAFDDEEQETEEKQEIEEENKTEPEVENRFANIFDAVENNSEVKIATPEYSTQKYQDIMKKILPDVVHEPKEEKVISAETTETAKTTEVVEFAATPENTDVSENVEVSESTENADVENPAVEIEIPQNVFADFVRADDVFSTMDSDAAENPVLKEPLPAENKIKSNESEIAETVETEAIESETLDEDDELYSEIRAYEDAVKAEAEEKFVESESDEDVEDDEAEYYETDYSENTESDEEIEDEKIENEENNFVDENSYDDETESDEEMEDDSVNFDIDDAWNNPTKAPSVEDSENVEDSDDIEENIVENYEDEEIPEVIKQSTTSATFTENSRTPEPQIDVYAASNNKIITPEKVFRKGPYEIPFDLLEDYPGNDYWVVDEETRLSGAKLKSTLSEFKIDVEITGIRKGPAVTMYELLPAPGVKLSKIESLQDNIALDLAASSVRIVAPIPGKHAVGIEVPNKKRAIVGFKELIEKNMSDFETMSIPVVLGKDISGDPQMIDLAKTPHLLIAGSTGAGKSVCVNTMLLSILYKRSPEQVKLVLVDPKVVEMKLYNDIPHLLTPVITEAKRALQALQYCLCEMERRYALLANMNVREIKAYNKKIETEHIATEKLPYIVVVIDEFADLMMTTGKELETVIARLAAKSRAIGIHLVLATQRPSTDVITGIIKANLPSRIAFMVASQMDSRVILDKSGAENLLGKGDMLYIGSTSPFPIRIQGTLVSDEEVERTVEYVKSFGEPEYIDDEMFVDEEDEEMSGGMDGDDSTDPLYDQALQIVIQQGKASASYIQRRLSIGYNRAARIVEEMEARGIVGPANGAKPREIIHMP